MKAIILVGGEGTRLRPLTLNTPKPLLPIANIAFLQRQLNWLKKYGVSEVVLSLGYLPDAFEEYFRANPTEGINMTYVVEDTPLGTAGAIKYAAQDIDEDFIVCNGDVWTDLDLSKLIEFHASNNSSATIALTHVEDPSAFGVVPTHGDGEVIAFVEKPPRESAPSHWINAGTYVLSPGFLDLIPDAIQVSVERETFPKLLEQGSMYAMESDCYWLDIGTPVKYLQAHSDYLSNIEAHIEQDQLKEIHPGLYSDGEVSIGENVMVKKPSIVGAGSTIGDNTALDGACLGPRCILEDSIEVTRSVIHAGARIDSFTRIQDSVVGDACDIGQNCVLEDETLVGAHEKIEAKTRLQASRVPLGV